MTIRTAFVAAAVIITTAGGATAQAPPATPAPCTYQACALRVQWRTFGGMKVVRGEQAERVGSFGFFGGSAAPLESGPEAARLQYRAFQNHNAAGTICNVLAVAAMIGAYATAYSDPMNRGSGQSVGQALLVGSLALTFIGVIERTSAIDHLEQAVWQYNRSLAEPAAPAAASRP